MVLYLDCNELLVEQMVIPLAINFKKVIIINIKTVGGIDFCQERSKNSIPANAIYDFFQSKFCIEAHITNKRPFQ